MKTRRRKSIQNLNVPGGGARFQKKNYWNIVLVLFLISFLTLLTPGCGNSDPLGQMEKASAPSSGSSDSSGGSMSGSRADTNLSDESDAKDQDLTVHSGGLKKGRFKNKENFRGTGKKADSQRRLSGAFLIPFEAARERLLEYNYHLSYRTESFHKSRQALLKIVGENGFIKSGNSSVSGTYPYMQMVLYVRAENFYKVIQELENLGRLVSERPGTIDHTENMVWQGIKAERERIRVRRKANIARTGQTSKNYLERVRTQEDSEDRLDKTKFERWKIKDKIQWGRIELNLRGPEQPVRYRVPVFKNAWIGLVNLSMDFLYGLLDNLPLLAALILLYWKRKLIQGFITGMLRKLGIIKENNGESEDPQ